MVFVSHQNMKFWIQYRVGEKEIFVDEMFGNGCTDIHEGLS